jgi:hypothetical protein
VGNVASSVAHGRLYAGELDIKDPLVSPLYADLTGHRRRAAASASAIREECAQAQKDTSQFTTYSLFAGRRRAGRRRRLAAQARLLSPGQRMV